MCMLTEEVNVNELRAILILKLVDLFWILSKNLNGHQFKYHAS